MLRRNRWIVLVMVIAGFAGLLLSGCSNTSEDEADASGDPATVEPVKGTDLSRVTLTAQAAGRIGIETAPVRRRGSHKKVIPYSAVLYDADGKTFTYTSPEPRAFVRHSISVDRIDGGQAILSNGPPAGTAVVTVGSQELYGVEYEVEED
jgi:hypothetical protein